MSGAQAFALVLAAAVAVPLVATLLPPGQRTCICACGCRLPLTTTVALCYGCQDGICAEVRR